MGKTVQTGRADHHDGFPDAVEGDATLGIPDVTDDAAWLGTADEAGSAGDEQLVEANAHGRRISAPMRRLAVRPLVGGGGAMTAARLARAARVRDMSCS